MARSSRCETWRRCATAAIRRQNIVRQDGVRGTLISVLKSGSASTLDVADGVKRAMAATPQDADSTDVSVSEFIDQSLFVRAAVSGVVQEGVIAAALTALMILLFLGSWRSTIIIALSIPLAVLVVPRRAQRARRDDQSHDARRSRARGRHSRG